MRNMVADCLDRLEEVIESGVTVPITGKKIINRIEALELIDQMRISLPEELKQASQGSDKNFGAAMKSFEAPVVTTTPIVSEMPKNLSNHELVVAAKVEAEKIIEEAKREAKSIKSGAEEYVETTLASLEDTLSRTARIVRKGIDELSKRKGGVNSQNVTQSAQGLPNYGQTQSWNQGGVSGTGTFPRVK